MLSPLPLLMRILAHIHGYPPHCNAGAEWMLHDLLHWLQPRHEVVVIIRTYEDKRMPQDHYVYDGIPVRLYSHLEARQQYQQADMVITHLANTGMAGNYANMFDIPVVHLIHNDHRVGMIEHRQLEQYVIYNADWVKQERQYPRESMVLHPPVRYADYHVERSDHFYTLINLNENKGGYILQQLAAAMPDQQFLGVIGSYPPDKQITDQPKNVTIVENTDTIQDVYERTRILLMPSKYESYGRTAVEACMSGIPTVANRTPGLVEALGDAGHWVDRHDIEAWKCALGHIESNYGMYSTQALNWGRKKDVEAERELQQAEDFLLNIKQRRQAA